ncbi:proline-rich protein HaeIII subfamily 1-like [Gavia stellata]|uniref:proline-rich protein HaeIII subfamily 1-like n=1 Tax=Gavia stellata TaxID=37040 RepID=UPI002896416D|nr:proline-rich protein HaeIII subfamily 1-like [Gavia stellata]
MARCPRRGRALARRGWPQRFPPALRAGEAAGGEGAPRSPSRPRWAILHFSPRAVATAPQRRSPDTELPPPGPPYRKYPSASPPRSAGRRRGKGGGTPPAPPHRRTHARSPPHAPSTGSPVLSRQPARPAPRGRGSPSLCAERERREALRAQAGRPSPPRCLHPPPSLFPPSRKGHRAACVSAGSAQTSPLRGGTAVAASRGAAQA